MIILEKPWEFGSDGVSALYYLNNLKIDTIAQH